MFYLVEDNKIIFGFRKYNWETGLEKKDFQHTSWLSSIADPGPRATTYCLLPHYVCFGCPHNRLCQSREIGDEFHYVLQCPNFASERKKSNSKIFFQQVKLSSLFNKKKPETIRKLCKLIDIINKKISSPSIKINYTSVSISIICI